MPVDVRYSLTEPYRALPGIIGAKPFVTLRLQRGDSFVDTWALIDSGAEQSLSHHDWRQVFGLTFDPADVASTTGIGGTAPI